MWNIGGQVVPLHRRLPHDTSLQAQQIPSCQENRVRYRDLWEIYRGLVMKHACRRCSSYPRDRNFKHGLPDRLTSPLSIAEVRVR